MSRASPPMRDFAQRLIAYEARANSSSGVQTPSTFAACEKLRLHLATLMGNAGFRALLSRALAMAQPQAPWLRAAHMKSDGSWAGLEKLAAQVEPQALAEGQEILLAQLLSLLVAFIGESLTLQMLRQVWPKLSPNDLNWGQG